MRLFLAIFVLGFLPTTGRPATEENPPQEVETENRFSLDFANQEVRTIIREIAEVHEINVVIPDSFQGTTSIKLRDVTWEQAFEAILKPLGWHYETDENIVLIQRTKSQPDEATPEPVKLISDAAEIQTNMLKSLLRDKEYADALATYHWNLYSALLEKGFSKDEALKIVLASPMALD
jgi:type II secretory pathway component HofQ